MLHERQVSANRNSEILMGILSIKLITKQLNHGEQFRNKQLNHKGEGTRNK